MIRTGVGRVDAERLDLVGGVKDGLEVLRPWLAHAVQQAVGSDH